MLLSNPILPGVSESGILIPGNFSGNPKKAVVSFPSPMPAIGYSITMACLTDGTKSFNPVIENKTVNGFTVNLHSNNVANLVEVDWHVV